VAVAAVGGGDVIIGAQGRDGANGHGLLPDAEVHGAVDFAREVEALRGLVERANEVHGVKEVH